MSKIEWGLAIGVALLYDTLNFLLGWLYLNIIIDIFAAGTFGLWFFLRGIKKRGGNAGLVARMGLPDLAGWIPGINLLPRWTAMVVITALEDQIVAAIKKIADKAKETVAKISQSLEGALGKVVNF